MQKMSHFLSNVQSFLYILSKYAFVKYVIYKEIKIKHFLSLKILLNFFFGSS